MLRGRRRPELDFDRLEEPAPHYLERRGDSRFKDEASLIPCPGALLYGRGMMREPAVNSLHSRGPWRRRSEKREPLRPNARPRRVSARRILAELVADVLAEAGWSPASLDLIAVTVGPGSFTGIRAGLALAHGIGLAAAVPVIGVTTGEALAHAVSPVLAGRALWSVTV